MKVLIITLIVIGLFLVTGCTASDTPSGPGPVTDAKDIVGTWQNFGRYTQFNEDGTYRFGSSIEGLVERPWVKGEYWFEKGQFFKKEIEVHNVPACGNAIGIYEVKMLENGNLVFTIVEDECEPRATKSEEYKRVG